MFANGTGAVCLRSVNCFITPSNGTKTNAWYVYTLCDLQFSERRAGSVVEIYGSKPIKTLPQADSHVLRISPLRPGARYAEKERMPNSYSCARDAIVAGILRENVFMAPARLICVLDLMYYSTLSIFECQRGIW